MDVIMSLLVIVGFYGLIFGIPTERHTAVKEGKEEIYEKIPRSYPVY